MAYTQEKKDDCFDWIIQHIEDGNSLISALNTNGMPSTKTFYEWLDEKDEQTQELTIEAKEKVKRYARACEVRELKLLDEILTIADKQDADVLVTDKGTTINHNVIQRNNLQIEARKWTLGKLNPTKYGNKVDVTSDNKPLQTNISILNIDPLSDDATDNSAS
jgi:hypothetical protein